MQEQNFQKNDYPLDLTIVIPTYNEEKTLHQLFEELAAVLRRLDRSYEILFILDGCTDGSLEIVRGLKEKDPNIRIIRFRRNYGQTAALQAGFDHARGEIIVAMDADLQNDPADIVSLLKKMEEGYDVVSGWRHNRQDTYLTRILPSVAANRLISSTVGLKLNDYGCTLKAYRAPIIKNMRLYGEMHRFIPALACWMGARITEIEVNHRPRLHGRSKYGISRTFRVFLDLMTVKFLL